MLEPGVIFLNVSGCNEDVSRIFVTSEKLGQLFQFLLNAQLQKSVLENIIPILVLVSQ